MAYSFPQYRFFVIFCYFFANGELKFCFVLFFQFLATTKTGVLTMVMHNYLCCPKRWTFSPSGRFCQTTVQRNCTKLYCHFTTYEDRSTHPWLCYIAILLNIYQSYGQKKDISVFSFTLL